MRTHPETTHAANRLDASSRSQPSRANLLRSSALALTGIAMAALLVSLAGAVGSIPCHECDDNYNTCISRASATWFSCQVAADQWRAQHCPLPGGGEDEFCLETFEQMVQQCHDDQDFDLAQCSIIADNCYIDCIECEDEPLE